MASAELGDLRPPIDYLYDPDLLPNDDMPRWFILSAIRALVEHEPDVLVSETEVVAFLMALPPDHRFAVMVGLVAQWGRLGATTAILETVREVAEP